MFLSLVCLKVHLGHLLPEIVRLPDFTAVRSENPWRGSNEARSRLDTTSAILQNSLPDIRLVC